MERLPVSKYQCQIYNLFIKRFTIDLIIMKIMVSGSYYNRSLFIETYVKMSHTHKPLAVTQSPSYFKERVYIYFNAE